MDIELINIKNNYYKNKVKEFLNKNNLEFEKVDSIYGIYDYNGDLIATGGRYRNILKYFAIEKDYQGQNLLSLFLTKLIYEIKNLGYEDIFVFTLYENEMFFRQNGFIKISHSDDIVFLNRNKSFLDKYNKYYEAGLNGAIVIDADPFTLEHKYLVKEALKEVDNLYIFIIEKEKSKIPLDKIIKKVKEGLKEFSNIIIIPSGDYIISNITCPTYFLKELSKKQYIYSEIDARIFKDYFVPKLNIKKRFVVEELQDKSIQIYNKILKKILDKDCRLIEINRKEINEKILNTSYVRRNLDNLEKIKDLVPKTTLKELI